MRLGVILWVSLCVGMTACKSRPAKEKETLFGVDSTAVTSGDYDLDQIQQSGELIMLTLYGPNTYFTYRDVDLGYQHDLCELFANELGVRVRVEVAKDQQELIRKLENGDGDLIAYNLMQDKSLGNQLTFCGNVAQVSQLLVQRKSNALKDVNGLRGKDVYVSEERYYQTLLKLNKALDNQIHIHKVKPEDKTTTELVADVSDGKIPYTICDNDMKEINQTYFQGLDISLKVDTETKAGWAVRKGSPLLAEAADEWFRKAKDTPAFKLCGQRYLSGFSDVGSGRYYASPMLSPGGGVISSYDALFRKYSMAIAWDWRLLAAQCYQESGFNPRAVSWAGAQGLMQLMPGTAAQFGLAPGQVMDPEQNVAGAVQLIRVLDRHFSDVADRRERISFILAAYNAGQAHIRDAMNLAAKNGKNPHVWDDNVEHYVLQMTDSRYYNDPVVQNGYFRGTETYNYVRAIRGRWNYYKSRAH